MARTMIMYLYFGDTIPVRTMKESDLAGIVKVDKN